MTPEERCQDIARHFPAILARWEGGSARMWELTTSHPTLTIVVVKTDREETLGIHCIEPTFVHGPCRWENTRLAVSCNERHEFVVRDLGADVEIRAGMVEIAEYKKRYSAGQSHGDPPQNTA